MGKRRRYCKIYIIYVCKTYGKKTMSALSNTSNTQDATKPTLVEGRKIITIDNYETKLHVDVVKRFLTPEEEKKLYDDIINQIPWFRVKYKSNRFKNQCTTPCWTNFYGGYKDLKQYKVIPSFLNPIIEKVSKACNNAKFNSILIRLYFDGNDNIAWHTDGRTFLGKTPTIGSLSLGHRATFEMRKMTNVWPCSGGKDNGIDTKVPIKKFICEGGDLLVMRNTTQQAWHHRVPKESYRRPRININFRYILPNRSDTERGQFSYYKYMVYGDEENPSGIYYRDIVNNNNNNNRNVSLKELWRSSNNNNNNNSVKNKNNYHVIQAGGGKMSSSSQALLATSTKKKMTTWTCNKCTLINKGSVNVCAVCFFAKDSNNINNSNNKRTANLLSKSASSRRKKKKQHIKSNNSKKNGTKNIASFFTMEKKN